MVDVGFGSVVSREKEYQIESDQGRDEDGLPTSWYNSEVARKGDRMSSTEKCRVTKVSDQSTSPGRW
jgi:hypothetical protein